MPVKETENATIEFQCPQCKTEFIKIMCISETSFRLEDVKCGICGKEFDHYEYN